MSKHPLHATFQRRQFLTSSFSAATAALILGGQGIARAEKPVAGKRPLGRSGIEITPLVLGANTFGWTSDKEASFKVLDHFAEAGLQAIDTADIYSTWASGNQGGESETIIGEWLKSRGNRDAMVVITKVGGEIAGGKGLSAKHIEKAAEDSLRRLQTDRMDVYFSHFPDPDVPNEETLGAYQKLIQAGKVRTIGASNFSAGQLRAALDASAAGGLPRYEVLQPRYNLYDREDFEGPVRDLAIAEGLGVITYSSLASGFLTGKYRSKDDLGQSVRGKGVAKYLDERGWRILAALDTVAARHGAELAEVSLAWIMAREGVTAPIASATSTEQLSSLIRSLNLKLSEDDLKTLETARALS